MRQKKSFLMWWGLFLLLSYCSAVNTYQNITEVAVALQQRINARLAECNRPIETVILNHDDAPSAKGTYEIRLTKGAYVATVLKNPLNKLWVVLGSIMPDPCSDDVLAVRNEMVQSINTQTELGWTAAAPEKLRGKTLADFGFIRSTNLLDGSPHKRRILSSDTDESSMLISLTDYDARDTYPSEYPCKAFQVRDQLNCGSCSYFAATTMAAARLCLRSGHVTEGNVVFSPMQMLSCMPKGCDQGSFGHTTAQFFVQNGLKENWCKPYILNGQFSCHTMCQNARNFTASGWGSGRGEYAMRKELLVNGPVDITIMLYDDFYTYKTGIYAHTAQAQWKYNHAMVLVGWGVENSVPYWLVQNSWGVEWGEEGFARIRRGIDEGGIESNEFNFFTPHMDTNACPGISCGKGSVLLGDCTCRCDNPFFTGKKCDQAADVCQNGAVRSQHGDACICPMGYFGRYCHYGANLSHYAAFEGTPESLDIGIRFTPPPEVGDYYSVTFSLYPYNAEPTYVNVLETATIHCWINTPCSPGTQTVSMRGAQWKMYPRHYKIHLSFQAYDQTVPGYYRKGYGDYVIDYMHFIDQPLVGFFTVLSSLPGTRAILDATAAANDPLRLLAQTLQRAADKQTSMTARLDETANFMRSISPLTPSFAFMTWGLKDGDVFFVNMPPRTVCYNLSFMANMPNKIMGIRQSGASEFLATMPTFSLLPPGTGCVNISFPLSLGTRAGLHELAIISNTNVLARMGPFKVSSASLAWNAPVFDAASRVLIVSCNVMNTVPEMGIFRASDALILFDRNNLILDRCLLFPNGLPTTPISSIQRCSFGLNMTTQQSTNINTPLTVRYYSNDNNAEAVVSLQQTDTAESLLRMQLNAAAALFQPSVPPTLATISWPLRTDDTFFIGMSVRVCCTVSNGVDGTMGLRIIGQTALTYIRTTDLSGGRAVCVNVGLPANLLRFSMRAELVIVDQPTKLNVLARIGSFKTAAPTLNGLGLPTLDYNARTFTMRCQLTLNQQHPPGTTSSFRSTDTLRLFDRDNVLMSTCTLYPPGQLIPTSFATRTCVFTHNMKPSGITTTRAPLRLEYYANDNTATPVAVLHQTAAQASTYSSFF